MAIHRLDTGIITQRLHDVMARLGSIDVTARTALVALSTLALMLAAIILQVRPLLARVSKKEPDAPPLSSTQVWNEIDTAYNLLVEDFCKKQELDETLASQLSQKAQNFKTNYCKEGAFPNYRHFIDEVIEKTIQNLRIEGKYIFIDIRKGGYILDKRGIIQVPGDGNCLYYSVATYLELYDKRIIKPNDLRAQTVQWMKDHKDDDQLTATFLATIDHYKDKERASLGNLIASATNDPVKKQGYENDLQMINKMETIEDYCNYALNPHKYATSMEVLALSHILQRPIGLHFFRNTILQNEYPPINGKIYPEERLLTLAFENDNHFNLKLPGH